MTAEPDPVAEAWEAYDRAALRYLGMYAPTAHATRAERLAEATNVARLWAEFQALFLKEPAA